MQSSLEAQVHADWERDGHKCQLDIAAGAHHLESAKSSILFCAGGALGNDMAYLVEAVGI